MRNDYHNPEHVLEALAVYNEISNRMSEMSETFRLASLANTMTEELCLDFGESGNRVLRNCDEMKKIACENEQIISEIRTELQQLLEELTILTPPQYDFQQLVD